MVKNIFFCSIIAMMFVCIATGTCYAELYSIEECTGMSMDKDGSKVVIEKEIFPPDLFTIKAEKGKKPILFYDEHEEMGSTALDSPVQKTFIFASSGNVWMFSVFPKSGIAYGVFQKTIDGNPYQVFFNGKLAPAP